MSLFAGTRYQQVRNIYIVDTPRSRSVPNAMPAAIAEQRMSAMPRRVRAALRPAHSSAAQAPATPNASSPPGTSFVAPVRYVRRYRLQNRGWLTNEVRPAARRRPPPPCMQARPRRGADGAAEANTRHALPISRTLYACQRVHKLPPWWYAVTVFCS